MAGLAVGVPVSSLLPPPAESTAPTETLPRLAAVLGPMPASAPLNVACACLSLSDLKPFHPTSSEPPIELEKEGAKATAEASAAGASEANDHNDKSKAIARALALLPPAHARVLVITGPRASWHADLEEEDAVYLRHMDVRVRDALRRTDVRYCPTADHLRLLTAVLSAGHGAESNKVSPPSLIVLYNVLDLFFSDQGANENSPTAEDAEAAVELVESAILSAYLDSVAATLAAARYFAEDTGPVPVLVLEPHGDVALPILPNDGDGPGVPPAQRRRKVHVSEGLRRLGFDLSTVQQIPGDPLATQEQFEVLFSDKNVRRAKRQPSTKAEFACPPREPNEAPERGGWEWTWA